MKAVNALLFAFMSFSSIDLSICAQNSVKVKTMKDGTQVYEYQNGLICIKSADYATERTLSEKTSITKIFSSDASYSSKIVNAASYSPTTSAIRAALFDACTQYGSGGLTKTQYDEERTALGQVQIASLTAQIKQPGAGSPIDTKLSPTANGISDPSVKTEIKPSQIQATKLNSALPTPKPLASGSDSHFDVLFKQAQGDELMLSRLGEEAFAKLDYAWTIKFLEQAHDVESSKVWQHDYPLLAAAYLLGGGNRDKFKETLSDMLTAMRLPNSYLHSSTTIGFTLQSLSNIRQYVDAEGQAYIDDTVTPAVIEIKKRITV